MSRDREISPEGEPDLLGYYSATLAYFRARLSRRLRDDSEDLAQDTLLAALRHQAVGGGPIRDAPAFLRGIAQKKLQNHLRNDQRKRRKEEAYAREQDGLAQRVADAAQRTRLEEERRQGALCRALKLLSRAELEILQLRCGPDELGNAEAARRLGVPAPDASRRFYRAREKLYKALRGDSTGKTS